MLGIRHNARAEMHIAEGVIVLTCVASRLPCHRHARKARSAESSAGVVNLPDKPKLPKTPTINLHVFQQTREHHYFSSKRTTKGSQDTDHLSARVLKGPCCLVLDWILHQAILTFLARDAGRWTLHQAILMFPRLRRCSSNDRAGKKRRRDA